ncbi:hypothetical protein SEPL_199 [Salmonella phage SE_PL]|uniref:hypothetical protein n=1 Tax=Salmonella enterica TaxID=28901 RepID=UPI000FDFAA15|nr:hypothetical protein CPT_Munch_228 [Salmonella phage Munch]EME3783185.1 hypothetical protein [Salmonella enterica]QCW18915.1 hypothetical protein 7t3_0394 [Salmonella phage 7t3]QIG62812.1 hypothetical protein SEPL_199 [Salmonella phage SE_PL]
MSYDYQGGDPESPQYDHREKLKDKITQMLGAGAVTVEITDGQLEIAIDNAIENYRAWSSASKEEAFLHMKLYPSESVYVLPTEVEIVRRIYRRGNGVVSGEGSTVDPFSLAYSNTYLLSAVRGATGGGLLTYDLYHQFDETVARLFGREIIFQWNPVNKKLIIDRDIRGTEEVLLHVYQNVPEEILFRQQMSYPWIRDWTLAEAKIMLGTNRSKFATLPGPQGTFSMDGDTLRQEGFALQEKLEQQLRNYKDGGTPLGFIIG